MLKKIFLAVILILISSTLLFGFWAYSTLNNSLPQLEGEFPVEHLSTSVNIERDKQGIATIKAENRLDIATATGFIHAQERFFQMDLLRRNSAGELSALFGKLALDYDKSIRIHRFRDRAKAIVKALPEDQFQLLDAYTKGVNQGVTALSAKPFEYYLLQQPLVPWQNEDSVLTILSMYLDLQYADGKRERTLGVMKSLLRADVYDFLNPKGSIWDATIDNSQLAPSPMPNEVWPSITTKNNLAVLNHSSKIIHSPLVDSVVENDTYQSDAFPGSNNWAVSGNISKTGSAIVADDMHLGIRMPNIWFRASFEYLADNPNSDQPNKVKVTGATLPGTPNMVVGSNGNIAWGFTNSYGDYSDIVLLKVSEDGKQYLTPNGYKDFEIHQQHINVKGEETASLTIKETIWGPVIGTDHNGHLMAYRWVAHDDNAVNLTATKLETAKDIHQAINIAHLSSIPSQNMMVGDVHGNIAWTIMGLIPKKFGDIGETPTFWHNGNKGWQGYLSPNDYPRVINPENNRLWTANSRVVGGEQLDLIGNGGYALGARTQQIRDNLFEQELFDEKDLLKIALDDKAIFLSRWQRLLQEQVLTAATIDENPHFVEVKALLEQSQNESENKSQTLRASTDSVAYLLVRNFRLNVRDAVFSKFDSLLQQSDEKFNLRSIRHQLETPLWEMVSTRTNEFTLLPKDSWSLLFNNALEKTLNDMTKKGTENEQPLAQATWGQYNTTAIKHPLSNGVPFIGKWLDMPATPLPGDSYMPRVQGKAFGASQRMVVSPGNEQAGIFHMPTSQSAHPLSPYFGQGHKDWEQGVASSFLPSKTKYILHLSAGN